MDHRAPVEVSRARRAHAPSRAARPARTPRYANPDPARLRSDSLDRDTVVHLQRTAGNAAVSGLLQRDAAGDDGGATSPVLDVVGRGGGRPMPDGVRNEMEGRLGADFSDVRIHTDSTAAASAAAVSARAYTVGNEVVFGSGTFAPDSAEGKHTLAHELTHVQQQRQGPVAGTDTGTGVSVSDPSDSFEQEAEANATRVLSGDGAAPVQRHADHDGETEAQDAPVQRHADHDHPSLEDAPVQRHADHDHSSLEDAPVQRHAEGEEDEAEEPVQRLVDRQLQAQAKGVSVQRHPEASVVGGELLTDAPNATTSAPATDSGATDTGPADAGGGVSTEGPTADGGTVAQDSGGGGGDGGGGGGVTGAPDGLDVISPEGEVAPDQTPTPAPGVGAPAGGGVTADDPKRWGDISAALGGHEHGDWAMKTVSALGVSVNVNFVGSGSFYTPGSPGSISLNKGLTAGDAAVVFVHEAFHAWSANTKHTVDIGSLAKADYVAGMINEETTAVINQISLVIEQGAKAAPDNDVPNQAMMEKYAKVWFAAHDTVAKNSDVDSFTAAFSGGGLDGVIAAMHAVVDIEARIAGDMAARAEVNNWFYDGTFVTSTTNQPYATYYGDSWDKVHAPPAK